MRKRAILVQLFVCALVASGQSQTKMPRKVPGAAKPECAQGAICFTGEVPEAQEFRKELNPDLDFVLTGGGGMGIVPRHPDDKNCDEFAHVVTGSQRAHNDLMIDASYEWTAEQEVQTSPREFRFVTNCADYRVESDRLHIVLAGSPDPTKYDEAFAKLGTLAAGQGRLWITRSKVTHAHDSVVTGHGCIEWMKFAVGIRLPNRK
jgi:hypothetical protein